MSAKKKKRAPSAEPVEVQALDILLDEHWHGRSEKGSLRVIPDAAEPTQEWSDEQLKADIRKRGLINPPRIAKTADGRWRCVAGARRLRALQQIVREDGEPERMVLCTYRAADDDDFVAAATMVAENMHRRRMEGFEVAEAVYRMHAARPDYSVSELAEEMGATRTYVNQLLIVRDKATPELWSVFQRTRGKFGHGVYWKDFVAVCQLPASRQLEAWNALVVRQERRAQRGRKPRKVSSARLRQLILSMGPPEQLDDFGRGKREGLLLALNDPAFPR